ncbi:gamma-glutamylcyclotransferase [Serratia sp. S1B]|nr:gamma-glutamylcyclotransferase [Serratia sp. S1B]
MKEHLFVYGTLGPNRPNSHILQNIDSNGIWKNATLYGKLAKKGWAAEMGFPGLVLTSDEQEEIKGFVFSSDQLSKHWHELDEFEGTGYARQCVEVTLENGDRLNTYVYALSSNPSSD